MADLFPARAGAVLSADIAVPEHEREVNFYSRVLCTGNDPLWGKDLMNNLGIPIIGLGERTDEYRELPLQWMPHIQVRDVAACAERAAAGGGRVLMQQKDADGAGLWAVLADPDGAAFGVMPVVSAEALNGSSIEGTDANAVGRIAWLDLTVEDADATRDFYRDVIGWTVQNQDMRDGDGQYADYVMLDEAGEPAAGVCHARGVNAGLPPVWLIYLPVDDLDASRRIVEQEGGRMINATSSYVVIQDPVGAYLALARR